jgi:hypothetical protein
MPHGTHGAARGVVAGERLARPSCGLQLPAFCTNLHEPHRCREGAPPTRFAQEPPGLPLDGRPADRRQLPELLAVRSRQRRRALSSGIGNHFFYLLAEGSGAKTIGGKQHNSPTCNGSTVTGIGRDAAAKIWFRALSVCMTSNTNYAGARTATLNAARDIHGTGSAQYNAVAAARSAVSVG